MSQNNELQAAAQAVLDRWNSPQWEWDKHGPTGDLMQALRAAIEAQAGQSASVAIPENVRVTAKSMQSNGYRGPLAWAATVIDFVADYTHPSPVRQPLTINDLLECLKSVDHETVRVPPGLERFARAIEAKINVPKQEDEVTTP